MDRRCLTWAAILGATGVALGAFGAHALRETVRPERLEVWHTATQYQMVHALALLALCARSVSRLTLGLLGAGVVVFSGSLYLLVLTDRGFFGAITPIGGVLLICAWLSLLRPLGKREAVG